MTNNQPILPTDDSTPTPVPEEPAPAAPEPVKEPEPVAPVEPVVSKPEPPKPEPPKPEPPKPEISKPEPSIPEPLPPAPSIPKVEDLEPPKVDTPKVEPPKVEPPKVDIPKKEISDDEDEMENIPLSQLRDKLKEDPVPKEPKVENISPAAPVVNDQNGDISDDLDILSSKKENEIKDAAQEEEDDEEQDEVNVGLHGAILLGLWYDSNSSKLSINVVKCRGLKAHDLKGTSDPYVKAWLCKNGKEFKKEKTSIKKGRLSPIYNETLEFDLPESDIDLASLKISVIDDDIGGNDLIGSILLGEKSEPTETQHWNDIFLNMGASVTAWHTLRYFD